VILNSLNPIILLRLKIFSCKLLNQVLSSLTAVKINPLSLTTDKTKLILTVLPTVDPINNQKMF
jgi:hypothetical protein